MKFLFIIDVRDKQFLSYFKLIKVKINKLDIGCGEPFINDLNMIHLSNT